MLMKAESYRMTDVAPGPVWREGHDAAGLLPRPRRWSQEVTPFEVDGVNRAFSAEAARDPDPGVRKMRPSGG